MDVSKIDKNFDEKTSLQVDNIKFHNITENEFSLFGIFFENGQLRRMPEAVAKAISPEVYTLHTHTAGGRVKFVTDSKYVALNTTVCNLARHPQFALSGSAGFDMYVDNEFYGAFVPPLNLANDYEGIINFEDKRLREITLNFPLYANVSKLYIGLESDAVLKGAVPYKRKTPIVFYGSSITHGACASRPGNTYESIISRRFDTDFINLGFGGSAKAEDEMANYIKDLNMSVFVYDYDHNAPDLEFLKKTHQKMFLTIREANPDLPIIMSSRPKYLLTTDEKHRLEIIKDTYLNAVSRGDKNVYFIEGPSLMQYAKADGTVEFFHPNDLGFYSIAKVLGDKLQGIL